MFQLKKIINLLCWSHCAISYVSDKKYRKLIHTSSIRAPYVLSSPGKLSSRGSDSRDQCATRYDWIHSLAISALFHIVKFVTLFEHCIHFAPIISFRRLKVIYVSCLIYLFPNGKSMNYEIRLSLRISADVHSSAIKT